MTNSKLTNLYQGYLDCLNRQDWTALSRFVDAEVIHNGQRLGLPGFRQLLEANFAVIPDLFFHLDLLVAESPYVANRVHFDCTPTGRFLGLELGGRRVTFTENIFCEFREEKIVQMWSVIDKAALEAQLLTPAEPGHA